MFSLKEKSPSAVQKRSCCTAPPILPIRKRSAMTKRIEAHRFGRLSIVDGFLDWWSRVIAQTYLAKEKECEAFKRGTNY